RSECGAPRKPDVWRIRGITLLTLAAFVAPILTPTLAAAQDDGEPQEMVPASELRVSPSTSFEALPLSRDDLPASQTRTNTSTRDPSLHSPSGSADLDSFTTLPLDRDLASSDEWASAVGLNDNGRPASDSTTPPVTTTDLPTGADKSGVTSKAVSIPKGSGTIQG